MTNNYWNCAASKQKTIALPIPRYIFRSSDFQTATMRKVIHPRPADFSSLKLFWMHLLIPARYLTVLAELSIALQSCHNIIKKPLLEIVFRSSSLVDHGEITLCLHVFT